MIASELMPDVYVISLLLTLDIFFASAQFAQIKLEIPRTLCQMVSMFKVRNTNSRFSAAYGQN